MNSWSSQDGAERSERQPQQQQFPPNPPPATKFFNIDGHHSRLTSALQVVTNALASAEQQVYNHDNHDNHEQSTTDDQPYDDHYDDDEELDEPDNPPSIHLPNNLGGQTTVVATDSDVSNGFVKSGRSLPYVFEANELGVRKRSSKLLPVCAVCGKRFVCVTTMKRHLVTHTGEKPFSCKVCGKQYTQKGNLRVHERTHRNDRPFECNICSQKFYRKEPMQKHQWRQHGIIHYKARSSTPSGRDSSNGPPPGTPGTPGTPAPGGVPKVPQQQPPTHISHHLTTHNPTIPHNLPPVTIEPIPPRPPLPPPPASYTALVNTLKAHSRDTSPTRNSPPMPLPIPVAHSRSREREHVRYVSPPPAHHHQGHAHHQNEVPNTSRNTNNSPPPPPSSMIAVGHLPHQSQNAMTTTRILEFPHAKRAYSSSPSPSRTTYVKSVPPQKETAPPFSSLPTIAHNKIPTSGDSAGGGAPNSHLLEVASCETVVTTPPVEENIEDVGEEQQESAHRPIKLKIKLARAYAKEQEETSEVAGSLDNMKIGDNKEMVECQCKTCGATFSVVDPYNFRCTNCNMKYTSMPTHLIADPLQCIGCCAVFPHKPALKAHQTVPDKERPFRCCKCGYGFRQKAHLQKHQWRIHRRKLEPYPGVKEAEAFFEVIQSSTAIKVRDADVNPTTSGSSSHQGAGAEGPAKVATITMQDIINHGVEKNIAEGPHSPMKTSSKYYSEVMGLEYDANASKESSPAPTPVPTPGPSTDMPLDLSPRKSLRSDSPAPASVDLKLRDLVASLPFNKPPSLTITKQIVPARQSSSSTTPKTTITTIINPLSNSNNNQPALLPSKDSAATNTDTAMPAMKKQKTTNNNTTATHQTLPPISGLQKPMNLVTKYKVPVQAHGHASNSAWIQDQAASLPGTREEAKPDRKPEQFRVRDQLELLRCHNARTV